MAKYAIIMCDLCGSRIYRDGYFRSEEGSISIRARELRWVDRLDAVVFPSWKRRKYHICPKCVGKIQEYCCGGKKDG